MRAGKLDRKIILQRSTDSVNDFGTAAQTWTDLASMRAELVEIGTDEFVRAGGAEAEARQVYRIRYVSDLTVADRLTESGRAFDIVKITEHGRRRELLLTVEEVTEK
ncbi:MAG: head-tail adaptor protein [Hoeflea sp.]|nr:head-tail adaptor protein [Hoeflea sp.]|tara:strand:+ start:5440 stop:5760 length:321 start_codon:yes stop_codon:yes gene_type:complete